MKEFNQYEKLEYQVGIGERVLLKNGNTGVVMKMDDYQVWLDHLDSQPINRMEIKSVYKKTTCLMADS